MFLFSTPSTRETTSANPVVSAIKQGADKTGVGFDYLLKTAQRESSLEPDAKARTSSATGLFQFIEQTWLSIMRQEGPKQGMANYAGAISEDGSGRLTVSDPALREKILQLRTDPQVATVMAGALTQKNAEQLGQALGRQPQAGELYMAHVLGARGATDLIRTAGNDPTRAAARDFPEAAAANRSIFYDKAGRARSAQEVYGLLAASHANTQVAATTGAMLAQAKPTGAATTAAAYAAEPPVAPIAAALAPDRARGLIGLFSTEGSRAPVSKAVANLWTTPRSNGTSRTTDDDPATRYFPRVNATASEGEASSAGKAAKTDSASGTTASTSISAPLPPSRPRDLAVADTQTASSEVATPRKPRRGPLDLSQFMLHGRRG
ncbi:Transglycosylase SLT domain-containing protein [Bosea sp. 62]|uniref:transglycosylase SLT domain-containing protein n=1 Tax=unclassified Bosea (in: a-proteobacteria) TaxID=2653178 RepID=UPI001253C4FB|nr:MULTISPECIES: transglycosylase SLT domain-containing protein [unclassified Bosea (in: a-proteobacteria)]CAD5263644.1 Transglycosylase SLT domain-containing protein [Bosea sp. 46]CAD5265952.1 Transglycosylase SLT domain-containing protein [Bosea sp. 21B]CAD5273789.1 Transglycosylase SLT domain-containing protein [Bosea sp. 7B]VVT56653.1 Transglycosylase SLT domain-containing protein [Bosea sp. EC-HK365B]VXB77957.1 Transglycosylase SLT domain-containing protein [Bosea sp. 29B]